MTDEFVADSFTAKRSAEVWSVIKKEEDVKLKERGIVFALQIILWSVWTGILTNIIERMFVCYTFTLNVSGKLLKAIFCE